MERNSTAVRFLTGFGRGFAAGSFAMLFAFFWSGVGGTGQWYASLNAGLHALWQFASLNLRGSVLPFALVLLVYLRQLQTLRALLAEQNPNLERVVRHEQLLDLCANLFVGVGVIWTAIGMRDALLHALGDPAAATDLGAFAVLQRMVDGGILLALSTTIVGGVGGYLMRTVKSVALGEAMNRVYMGAAQQPASDSLAALRRIETLLSGNTVGEDRPVP